MKKEEQKNQGTCQENCPSKNYSPDIDHGWAIVVAVAGFFNFLLVRGMSYSSAVFYIVFLDEFEDSPSTTACIVSIQASASMIFAPIASSLLMWLSKRKLLVMGGILSSSGFILSSFVYNIHVMMLTFGILIGFGWCFINILTFVVLTEYFSKYRLMAITLAISGVAAGQFVLPPILQHLFDKYHWRGAFLIVSAINLHFLVSAAIMMPPRRVGLSPSQTTSNSSDKIMCKSCLTRQVIPLKNTRYVLFLVSAVVMQIGMMGFLTHIGNYARNTGSTDTQAALIVSFIGAGSFICRVTIASVIRFFKASTLFIYIIYMCLASLVCFFITLFHSFYILFIFTLLFGFATGSAGLVSEVVLAINGIQNFDEALGQAFFTAAIGALLAGPITGWLYQIDPLYHLTFVFCGLSYTFTVVLIVPAYRHSKFKGRDYVTNVEISGK